MREKGTLNKKSFMFAIRIINLGRLLINDKKEFIISKQLMRSGTAVGALVREAEYAQSKADFLNKLHIALKEANEAEYWIELLFETKFLTETEFKSILNDNKELIKLLIASTKTVKQNLAK